MQAAKTGLQSSDAEAVRHAAHTLKGMVGIFSAERAMQAAEHLEQCAAAPEAAAALAALESALQDLDAALRAYTW
ncbi:MAG: hypothetical protein Fur0026_09930 [Sideroxydans sp.]